MRVKAEGASLRLAVGLPGAAAIQPPTEEPQPSCQQALSIRRRCGPPGPTALGFLGLGPSLPGTAVARRAEPTQEWSPSQAA